MQLSAASCLYSSLMLANMYYWENITHCESGRIHYHSSCYAAFHNKPLNRDDSREDCVKRGGDLVDLNTKGEYEFLKQLTNVMSKKEHIYYFWTGVNDLYIERGKEKLCWQNPSGKALLYGHLNWAPHNPGKEEGNGQPIHEGDCVAFHRGQVFDRPCNDTHYWICEFKAKLNKCT